MSLSTENSHSPCWRCSLNLPLGVCGFQMEYPISQTFRCTILSFGRYEFSPFFFTFWWGLQKGPQPKESSCNPNWVTTHSLKTFVLKVHRFKNFMWLASQKTFPNLLKVWIFFLKYFVVKISARESACIPDFFFFKKFCLKAYSVISYRGCSQFFKIQIVCIYL